MSRSRVTTPIPPSIQRKGMLPNPRSREGERPREPKHLWNSEEIRAREDARPPIKKVGQHARLSV